MNISLAGILSRNAETTTRSDAANVASALGATKSLQAAMVIDNLHVGQTISGFVKSVSGSQILLEIGNGVEINARLSGGMDIGGGKNLLFEVTGHADGKVTLSPLHTNLSATESTIAGALKAAGLVQNDTHIQMVQSMMDEGMSIDKNSVFNMGKQLSAFPEATPETIVKLQAMGMEITPAHIAGFEAVQNLQHQIIYATKNLMSGMEQILTHHLLQGSFQEGSAFLKDLVEAFPEFTSVLQMGKSGESTVELQSAVPTVEIQETGQSVAGMERVVEQPDAIEAQTKLGNPEWQNIDFEQAKEQFEHLSKQVMEWFGKALEKEWTIKPEEFAQKEVVKEFYHKIIEQSQKLMEFLNHHDKMETVAGKEVSSIRQNLQFLESVNQAFPYLQIPLKGSVASAHGDLYVYSGRKNQVSEEGSYSALLHLEMMHLGNMDIYVKLTDQNVNTQFMLENESILDFLEQHMDLLTTKLAKKGYHLHSEVLHQEEQKNVDGISRIRGLSQKETLISYTSFDVRA